MKKLILSLFALFLSFAASAGGVLSGTASGLYALPVFMVVIPGSPTGTPSCAAANPNRWAISPSTTDGRNQIALIEMAAALGKTMTIVGTGTCSVWSDTETVATVTVAL